MPIKIARPFNTYGPRQSLRAIIPTIITQLLSEKKYIKLGNINSTRDFTYVEDTCNGLISIINSNDLIGEITNIGSNNEISIKEVFEITKKILNSESNIKIEDTRKRPIRSEVSNLNCDNTKILSKTDWKPKYNFESGLEKTVSWIRQNINNFETDKYVM
tara:strand:- start:118 stop:597 length:480 start_codon:yes stop_codon:yes gene_type:complete